MRTQSDEAFGDNHNRPQEHNLIMFTPPYHMRTQRDKRSQRSKGLLGGEDQEMTGNLVRDSPNKTSHRKCHTSRWENR